MNIQKNLYVIFYVEDPNKRRSEKVVKVFTTAEQTVKYLLTKVTIDGKKVPKDNRWILQVFNYIPADDRYEFSKWETAQVKSVVGICTHCHEYFARENNLNMCDNCFLQVQKGLQECDVCHQFFNPIGTKFVSNGDVFPSLACVDCSKDLIKNLKLS
ncbi:hypothetical protein SSYRP_v1c02550 [Spiroplasma syrphidicola EA-1]|uniref:Uncharacterized protein n=1 Tax=Spiroplasma syrphidicola EA-1 TaxID=1276229 RepID=R4UKQ6_9MOLU|nr:hypothetical protein [Spiroplasma syrphidicola]AGM25851.1 hypothetical protein SSYRP_v1c02550 [Spiroplasma syrphidicola EA-1]